MLVSFLSLSSRDHPIPTRSKKLAPSTRTNLGSEELILVISQPLPCSKRATVGLNSYVLTVIITVSPFHPVCAVDASLQFCNFEALSAGRASRLKSILLRLRVPTVF